MATPMTADQFLKALRGEGLTVTEHAGWRTHNREGHGGWGPMNGVMIHHTGGPAPSDGQVVWAGRSDLPGPCAHGYLAKSGVVTMMANGRANHAGTGDPAVLSAVVNESYATAPPATHFHDGEANGADGNSHFYGLEVSNLGTAKDPYPAVQYEAAVMWAAAICRFHGWSAKSVIGHKEWSDWKPDPIFSMVQFRADVQALLDEKPAAEGGIPSKETTVSDTDAHVASLYTNLMTIGSLTETDAKGARVAHAAGYYLAHIHSDTVTIWDGVVSVSKKLDAQAAQIAALTKALAALAAAQK